jgi:hypothetical protein
MTIIKFTASEFDRDSKMSPDNYYFNECDKILDTFHLSVKEIDLGGSSGQCGGYIYTEYEYLENKIKKDIFIKVSHQTLDIEIEVSCSDENMLKKFLDKLKKSIKNYKYEIHKK